MSTPLLIGIICGGVLLILIVAIIFIRRANKKRFKKLQENLQKYKTENEELDHENKITLSKDQEPDPFKTLEEKPAENNAEHHENKIESQDGKQQVAKKTGPIIEDYIAPNQPQPRRDTTIHTIRAKQPRNLDNKSITDLFAEERAKMDAKSAKNMPKDDFEEFLDEHAYSRRILNKDILSKIKDLPPEIKAVILSNVFNKYDD